MQEVLSWAQQRYSSMKSGQGEDHLAGDHLGGPCDVVHMHARQAGDCRPAVTTVLLLQVTGISLQPKH